MSTGVFGGQSSGEEGAVQYHGVSCTKLSLIKVNGKVVTKQVHRTFVLGVKEPAVGVAIGVVVVVVVVIVAVVVVVVVVVAPIIIVCDGSREVGVSALV